MFMAVTYGLSTTVAIERRWREEHNENVGKTVLYNLGVQLET